MADDEDRPRDAGGAADRGTDGAGRTGGAGQDTAWAEASAPDDISELARDIRLYHRELRANRRREKFGRLLNRPSTEPLTLLGSALVLAAIVAAAITLVQPKPVNTTLSALAPATSTRPVGTVGGLVPAVTVSDQQQQTATVPVGPHAFALRALRPAVLLLLPSSCTDCNRLIGSLNDEAAAYSVAFDVIAAGPSNADLAALAGTLPDGGPSAYYDTTSQLRSQFAARGLTIVVVGRHGIITAIERGVTANDPPDLTTALGTISGTKAAAS
ncbi:MAG TPA: hypothetical protein VMH41_01185 [Mycobacteriales bacterium]|nr:hypothetical protein [Mycobacteriales bacterium]